MKDRDKTKEQLIKELEALRRRVGEPDKSGEERKKREEALWESQEKFGAIFENINELIVYLDKYGNVINANRRVEDILGYKQEEVVGKHFIKFGLFSVKNLPKITGLFSRAIRGNPIKLMELEIKCKDGNIIPIETSTTLVKRDGKVQGMLVVVRDITERKQAEIKLEQAMAALKRSNAELEQLAYIASHDLQEPLRMVASYVQLLERRYKGKLDKDADDFIAYAVDGATRMQHMINDLLTYSRVSRQGKEFQPTNCEDVLRQVLANLKLTAEESSALVTHDPLPTVMADESQLVQLFQNLLSNAIRYRGQELPQIHVSAVQKGNEWVFAISDNGIGIEPQYFDRIFQMFQRLHGKEYPGSGIGLSVAKRIVERHGGRIWVESEIRKGSTFYFTIPSEGGKQS